MKEKILDILKSEQNAITTEELCSKIDNISTDEIMDVQNILNQMVQSGEIYFTNKGKYILFER